VDIFPISKFVLKLTLHVLVVMQAAGEALQTVVRAGKAPRREKKCEHDKTRKGCKLCNKQAVCEHDRFRRSRV
jgi:hypothetical protein